MERDLCGLEDGLDDGLRRAGKHGALHHDERLGEVIAAMKAGATTCYEIARGVKWSIGHFDKFDWGTRRAAMSETLSHLRHLNREGRVTVREVDGIDHWTPTGRSVNGA